LHFPAWRLYGGWSGVSGIPCQKGRNENHEQINENHPLAAGSAKIAFIGSRIKIDSET